MGDADEAIGCVVSIGSGLFSAHTDHVVSLAHDLADGPRTLTGSVERLLRLPGDSVGSLGDYLTMMVDNCGHSHATHMAVEEALPGHVPYFRYDPKIAACSGFTA